MKLSIIICAYNEERTIRKVLTDIAMLRMQLEYEIIVVDDGSTDGTPAAVRGAGVPVVYVRQPRNLGKGAAMRKGISLARGEFILIQDADLEYTPADYPRLLEPLLSGRSQVVYGSRILKKGNPYSYRSFYFGGRLVSLVTNLLYGSSITDEPTGYKLFSTSLLRSLELTCQGFEFCPEVTAKILRRAIPVVEVPISYAPRSKEEGKKITWKDGFVAISLLFRLRFSRQGITGRRRVLYVSPFSIIGGGERSLMLILNNLDRSSWDPFVACYSRGPLTEKLAQMNIPVEIISRQGFLGSAGAVFRLLRLIRARRIDLVHVNSLDIRAGLAAAAARVPCIGHLRVIFPMTWVDRAFVRLSRATAAVSTAVIREFRGGAKTLRKFVLLPNAVDVPPETRATDLRQEFGLPRECRIVGTCGRMEPWKGFECFIDGCRLVADAGPDVRFVILGGADGEREQKYLDLLKDRVRRAGLEDRFIFTGFREDVLSVIGGFDVLVAASIPVKTAGGRINEGFGRTAIEAMAMGVPLVASRTGGLAESVEDGVSGLLVESGDAGAMAGAVLSLLRDPAKREALAAGGRKRFEALFTARRHLDRLQSIYRRALRLPLKGVSCGICAGTEFRMVEDSGGGYSVFQCLTCQFTFVYPQPGRVALESNYSSGYYRPWHSRAQARRKMWQRRLEMLEAARGGARGRLLDIGCGEGDFLRLAREAGWDTTGTEVSRDAWEAANAAGVKVLRGALEELNLPGNSFDAITLWHVLEHASDPLSLLKECRRLVRDDGVLVVALPNLDNPVFRFAYMLCRGRRLRLFDPAGRELHLFHFSPLTLRMALENAGFRVESVRADKGIVETGKRIVDMAAGAVSAVFHRPLNAAITAVARPSGKR